VHDFRQNLDTSLHSPFMVFPSQVVWCELIFQTVGNGIGSYCREECEA